MANSAGAVPITAAARLKSVAGLGAIGLGLSGMYAMTGIGIPCPWRSITHTLCPFCGATTMGADLLRGDLVGAWSANPFVLTILAGVAVASVLWIVELRGGPRLQLPRPLTDQRFWYTVLAITAIAFAVWRNLVATA